MPDTVRLITLGSPRLLLLILLLFKYLLFICVVARGSNTATRVTATAADVGIAHSRITHATLLRLHGLHLLQLLHLRQHRGVHTCHGSHSCVGALWTLASDAIARHSLSLLLLHRLHSSHLLHLCHHSRIHTTACTHGQLLLLDKCKVLLHTLKVLRHHLRGHATRCHLIASLLLLLIVRVIMSLVASASFPESVPSTPPATIFFLSHIAARLCLLNLDRFS
jgi:hypothetical protein